MSAHSEILQSIYAKASDAAASNDLTTTLSDTVKEQIDLLVSRSESNKAMVAVLTTLLVHKIVDADQDIRYHQAQLKDGFAGRTIDKDCVTPFMKSVNFPAMAESGWLTRSFEQVHPYTLDYPGKITPLNIKTAFLELIDEVQTQGISAESILLYFFIKLIKQRDDLAIELAKPHSLSISKIISLMEKHFVPGLRGCLRWQFMPHINVCSGR